MKVAVYDTYVTRKDGNRMHFDIIVPIDVPESRVLAFGNEYLKKVGEEGQQLTPQECKFCHVEPARPTIVESILAHGFHIYKMEGCR